MQKLKLDGRLKPQLHKQNPPITLCCLRTMLRKALRVAHHAGLVKP